MANNVHIVSTILFPALLLKGYTGGIKQIINESSATILMIRMSKRKPSQKTEASGIFADTAGGGKVYRNAMRSNVMITKYKMLLTSNHCR